MSAIQFNTNQNHPLIKREQTYLLDTKFLTIHSIDRDINKWANGNEFEVELPENLKNVYSLRLASCILPNNLYNITNNYQNTKFSYRINPKITGSSTENTILTKYFCHPRNYFTVTLDDGYYTTEYLVNTLQYQLNHFTTQKMIELGMPSTYSYDHFIVKYHALQNKFIIANDRDQVILNFDLQMTYNNLVCNQKIVFDQYANWGLGYNLGFEKQTYSSSETTSLKLIYTDPITEITPSPDSSSGKVYYITSPLCVNLVNDNAIYMELEKYNNMDEIEPYSQATNNEYDNDYQGKVNVSFAKIPLRDGQFKYEFDNKNDSLTNFTIFNVPQTKIRKMKFKFRFHDGQLVDFCGRQFSFLIEATQLLDEQARHLNLRIPPII